MSVRDELGELLFDILNSKRDVLLQQGEHCMTFPEMQQRVLRLAFALGSGEGHVAICVHPSFGLVVSLIAVLYKGRAFVPLDPTYPSRRLQFILEDSEAKVMVSQQDVCDLPFLGFVKVLIDSSGACLEDGAEVDTTWATVQASEAAYIIYTSGSTGLPKGVVVSRQNFANVLIWFKELLEAQRENFQPRVRWIAHTTICFDIALLEFFLPLIGDFRNAVLEILDRSISQSGELLKHHLEADVTTIFQATPSSFNLLRSAGWTPRNSWLLCGGELFPTWLTSWSEINQLFNVYGPTETTIWSLVHRVKQLDSEHRHGVPIGKPIRSTTAQLDTSLETGGTRTGTNETSGARGELVIGGSGVSLGYWKQPELTKSRFFEVDGVRHFRTGDLVEIRETEAEFGQLFCLGRLDEQVKLNGFRIELGEIEALLYRLGMQAAVQVRSNHSGSKVLVAYVVNEIHSWDPNEIIHFLQKHLPDYMLPQHWVTLRSLPMTLNGPPG